MDSDYYYMGQSTGSQLSEAEVMAIIGSVAIVILVIALVSYAVTAWLLGRIFKKAGVKQWIAWVPIYNNWKMLELGNQQGFWAVLAIIPPVNIISAVFTFIAMHHIGKKLGKEDWFVILAIFLPIIWLVWLAFDDSKWPTAAKPSATSPEPIVKE